MSDPPDRGTSNRGTGSGPQPVLRKAAPAGLYRVDFYDRGDPHLGYLGRLTIRYKRDRRQIRLIHRADLIDIFNKNRALSGPSPSNFSVNLPGIGLQAELFPAEVGLFQPGQFDGPKIEIQSRTKSLILRVTPNGRQKQQLADLYRAAKKTGKEQGLYIVVQRRKPTASLHFLPGVPVKATADEYVFCIGTQRDGAKKITYPCTPEGRPTADRGQVIGTVHTHYLKRKASIDTRNARMGTTFRQGETITKLTPAVSETDMNSAREEQIVVYAIDGKHKHKAMPDGTAVNELTTRGAVSNESRFNLLVDAIESFAGKRPTVSG